MKYILLFLSLPCFIFAQQTRYIEYSAIERPVDAEYDSIVWRGTDKIYHEFNLNNSPATCRLTVIANSQILLEQFIQNKWQLVDTLYYVVFPMGGDEFLTPQFEITDFSKDGLDDFLFLGMTNMHGNMPYNIYLQRPDGQLVALKRLENLYPDENEWPSASYDAATQTITCQMPGGVFGSSWEATYHLEGFEAKPLHMHNEQRNTQTQFEQHFTGDEDKWILNRQTVFVAIGMGYEDYDTMEVLRFRLEQQQGNDGLNFYLTGDDDGSEAEGNNVLVLLENIPVNGFVSELEADNFYDHFPGYMITDFNHDGNQDLIFYLGIDVHGSTEALIFLSDRKAKKLIKLQNTAEGTDIWDTPEYDPKTGIITCRRISGNAGMHFTSTYKLKGFTAQPLKKEVRDFTNVNGETGKGYSESTYTGKKGKWKLESTVTDE
jgi:hypothetical protein